MANNAAIRHYSLGCNDATHAGIKSTFHLTECSSGCGGPCTNVVAKEGSLARARQPDVCVCQYCWCGGTPCPFFGWHTCRYGGTDERPCYCGISGYSLFVWYPVGADEISIYGCNRALRAGTGKPTKENYGNLPPVSNAAQTQGEATEAAPVQEKQMA